MSHKKGMLLHKNTTATGICHAYIQPFTLPAEMMSSFHPDYFLGVP
jgi:hypothetical protein